MLAEEKVKEKWKKLVGSPICIERGVEKYRNEFKQLAGEVANQEHAETKSWFFKALADATRIRIIKLLLLREMCVCELMTALELTQPAASYHLGILEKAGLIKRRKRGKWAFYGLKNRALIKEMEKLGLL